MIKPIGALSVFGPDGLSLNASREPALYLGIPR